MKNMNNFFFWITGKVPSKKNRYEISRGRIYLHPDIDSFNKLAYVEMFIGNGKSFIQYDTAIELKLEFYCDDRSDLDNMIGTICDMLQKNGVILNDRLIRKITADKFIDKLGKKELPRTRVEIVRINDT